MQKSMWTSYFVDLSPEEAVRLFVAEGWTCLELSDEHSAVLLERGEPAVTGREFRRFCADAGVSLPQGHLKLNVDIAHPDVARRRGELEELKSWLDLFAALQIRAAVLHPGGPNCLQAEEPSQAAFDANVESLRELTRHTAGGSPVIGLENGPNARRLLSLIEAVGSEGLGVCCDTGHLSVLRTKDPEAGQTERDFIVQAGRRLKALHIADNDGSGDQHLLPYEGGNVDWRGVMQGLREIAYGGPFNFEVPGEIGRDKLLPIDERVAKLRRAARLADRLMETTGRSLT